MHTEEPETDHMQKFNHESVGSILSQIDVSPEKGSILSREATHKQIMWTRPNSCTCKCVEKCHFFGHSLVHSV